MEPEKLQRAKDILDHLANGVNPFTNAPVPDYELLNNVRISRCFFFVSDILRQIIENGRICAQPEVPVRRREKPPLSIPSEQRAAFAFSHQPLTASEIAVRINRLAPNPSMRKLNYEAITSFLCDIGMLQTVPLESGKRTRRPTALGLAQGISVEERTSPSGTYQVVVYNRQAQQFLLENLDSLLESEALLVQMQGQPWTAQQDSLLTELHRSGTPVGQIAAALHRRSSAVRSRLKKLGLTEPVFQDRGSGSSPVDPSAPES